MVGEEGERVMEYKCTCGRVFEAEYERMEDYYYDYKRGKYVTVWIERCGKCGGEYITVDE